MARLRLLGFDILQQTLPRMPDASYPVRIVDIDEPSIKAFGNWPWRRDLLARLIDKLFASGVRVVVFDMVFPEPTGGRARSIAGSVAEFARIQAAAEQTSRGGIAPTIPLPRRSPRHPTVLGIIGTSQAVRRPAKGQSIVRDHRRERHEFVPNFAGASGNLPALEEAAAGIGALNWLPDHDQILRRIPLVVAISGKLYPSLVDGGAARLQRRQDDPRALGRRWRLCRQSGHHDRSPSVKPSSQRIVTASSGFRSLGTIPKRTISAADVLQGKAPANALDGRIAIIGTSAPGLLDLRATPLDPIISGVEINAQALEQLLTKRLLIRPDYAVGMEIVLTVASALLLGLMVYWWGARVSAAVGFATVCLFSLGSLLAFSQGLLLDAVFPIMTSTAAYIFGTGYLYYEAESERNRGREALQRIAREMEAAAQIQRTFLPKELPTGPFDSKFEIFAVMKPAKAVGGDFYDYFLINDRKLGFVVGDVSGKGVPAALFMSVSRTVLRTIAFEGEEPGIVLSKVNAILSRDNTEGMFVTIFYAALDLETGRLAFSSAGHDDALLLTAPTPASRCATWDRRSAFSKRRNIRRRRAISPLATPCSCSPMASPRPSISMVAFSPPTASRDP